MASTSCIRCYAGCAFVGRSVCIEDILHGCSGWHEGRSAMIAQPKRLFTPETSRIDVLRCCPIIYIANRTCSFCGPHSFCSRIVCLHLHASQCNVAVCIIRITCCTVLVETTSWPMLSLQWLLNVLARSEVLRVRNVKADDALAP